MLNDIIGSFTQFVAHLDSYDIVFSLLLYTFIIFVYSVFVWFFYRTLSKRDLFHLAIKEQRHAWRKKVIQGPFMGWKILRIGRKQRLFLLVDEENKSIRLIPFLRDQAYS